MEHVRQNWLKQKLDTVFSNEFYTGVFNRTWGDLKHIWSCVTQSEMLCFSSCCLHLKLSWKSRISSVWGFSPIVFLILFFPSDKWDFYKLTQLVHIWPQFLNVFPESSTFVCENRVILPTLRQPEYSWI